VYSALKEMYPDQRLILFGRGDLQEALLSVNAIIVEEGKIPRSLMFLVGHLFYLLAKARLVWVFIAALYSR